MTIRMVRTAGVVLLLSAGALAAETKGLLRINHKGIALSHVVAYSRPDASSQGAIEVVVVLSDKPLPKRRLAPAEGVQGIVLTIQRSGRVRAMRVYHDALGKDETWALTNGTPIQFDSQELTDKRISGRAHAPNAPEEFSGITLDAFDATFSVDIVDPKTLIEQQ